MDSGHLVDSILDSIANETVKRFFLSRDIRHTGVYILKPDEKFSDIIDKVDKFACIP